MGSVVKGLMPAQHIILKNKFVFVSAKVPQLKNTAV